MALEEEAQRLWTRLSKQRETDGGVEGSERKEGGRTGGLDREGHVGQSGSVCADFMGTRTPSPS